MRIKTGDTVKVLYGKDAGKKAKVLKVMPKKGMVVVDGVNKVKKHVKGDGRSRESAIVELMKPVPVSKVQVVDPNGGKATRVSYKGVGKDKVRVAVKSGKDMVVARKNEEPKKKPAAKKETETKKKEVKKETKKSK